MTYINCVYNFCDNIVQENVSRCPEIILILRCCSAVFSHTLKSCISWTWFSTVTITLSHLAIRKSDGVLLHPTLACGSNCPNPLILHDSAVLSWVHKMKSIDVWGNLSSIPGSPHTQLIIIDDPPSTIPAKILNTLARLDIVIIRGKEIAMIVLYNSPDSLAKKVPKFSINLQSMFFTQGKYLPC